MNQYEVSFEKNGKKMIDTVMADSHYHARGIIHLEYGSDVNIQYVLKVTKEGDS